MQSHHETSDTQNMQRQDSISKEKRPVKVRPNRTIPASKFRIRSPNQFLDKTSADQVRDQGESHSEH